MIKFAGGRFDELASHFQNLMNMSGFKADQVAGNNKSEVFGDDPLGDGTGSKKFPGPSTEDPAVVSTPTTVTNALQNTRGGSGPMTVVNINANVKALGVNGKEEVELAVANALNQAKKRGILVAT